MQNYAYYVSITLSYYERSRTLKHCTIPGISESKCSVSRCSKMETILKANKKKKTRKILEALRRRKRYDNFTGAFNAQKRSQKFDRTPLQKKSDDSKKARWTRWGLEYTINNSRFWFWYIPLSQKSSNGPKQIRKFYCDPACAKKDRTISVGPYKKG